MYVIFIILRTLFYSYIAFGKRQFFFRKQKDSYTGRRLHQHDLGDLYTKIIIINSENLEDIVLQIVGRLP